MHIILHLDNILFSVTSKDEVITDFKAKLLASPGYRSLAYSIRYLLKKWTCLKHKYYQSKQGLRSKQVQQQNNLFYRPDKNRNRIFFSFGGISVCHFMKLPVSMRLPHNLSWRLSKYYLQWFSQVLRCLWRTSCCLFEHKGMVPVKSLIYFCHVNQSLSVQKA